MSRKWGRKKGRSIFFVLACAMLLCTACGAKEPPEPEDWSGAYTDKQGTPDVYSELILDRNEDGSYAVELGIYRVATLRGTATEEDGVLRFAGDADTGIHLEGDITINGDAAGVTITKSDFPFPELAAGTTLTYPDEKEA